jgi:thiamine pyrophosphokinase
MPAELLARWLGGADLILAADGGGDLVLEAGFRPHHIIGDLDSLTMAGMASGAEVHSDLDLDRTDCDKLLDLAESLGVCHLVLTSLEGDRPDHWFASLASAAAHRMEVVVATRSGLLWHQGVGSRTFEASPERLVSILPWGGRVNLSTQGLRWELEHAELSTETRISVSNRTMGWEFAVHVHAGSAWIYMQFDPEEMPRWRD